MHASDSAPKYRSRRQSYMAEAPLQPPRSVTRKLGDVALHLCSVTWLGTKITKVHAAHEYKKDRRRMEDQYHAYQEKAARSRETMRRAPTGFARSGFPSTWASRRPSTSEGAESIMRTRVLEWQGGNGLFSPGLLSPGSVSQTESEWADTAQGWSPVAIDSEPDLLEKTDDPWLLPPIGEGR